jgi:hypothetical protein
MSREGSGKTAAGPQDRLGVDLSHFADLVCEYVNLKREIEESNSIFFVRERPRTQEDIEAHATDNSHLLRNSILLDSK